MSDIDPRDPRALAGDAPLFDAWLTFTRDSRAGRLRPFSIPGHKHRHDLVGDLVQGDVPMLAGLDTMKQSLGLLAAAESRAADAWGTDWARLSVGGSTHANQASVLALGQPGQSVIVSRTLHRSVLLGLVLAGLRPVWVHPAIDAATGLPGAVPVAAVETALSANPDACGVLVGDPASNQDQDSLPVSLEQTAESLAVAGLRLARPLGDVLPFGQGMNQSVHGNSLSWGTCGHRTCRSPRHSAKLDGIANDQGNRELFGRESAGGQRFLGEAKFSPRHTRLVRTASGVRCRLRVSVRKRGDFALRGGRPPV